MLRMRSLYHLLIISVLICSVYSQSWISSGNIRITQETSVCYGSVLDAGSSSTKVNVYSWTCRDSAQIPRIKINPILSFKTSTGLSTFSTKMDEIPKYFQEILLKIREVIPKHSHKSSPIMLGATAGLRLLNETQQNQIMSKVQSILRGSGFFFAGKDWGRVITGSEEGVFLWMSINYIREAIKDLSNSSNADVKTAATIDLGGASTQITFQVSDEEDSNYPVSLPQNNDYSLHTESYLKFGNDQARNNVVLLEESDTGDIHSGCFNSGYNYTDPKTDRNVIGTSQPEKCLEKIRKYFSKTGCRHPERCSINGSFLPLVPVDSQVIGVSGIYNAVSSFNVSSPFLPTQLLDAANKFCKLPYEEVKKQEKESQYTPLKCFLGLYSASLLSEAYNLKSHKIYSFQKMNETEPSWALGYLISNLGELGFDFKGTIPSSLPSSPSPNQKILISFLDPLVILLCFEVLFHVVC